MLLVRKIYGAQRWRERSCSKWFMKGKWIVFTVLQIETWHKSEQQTELSITDKQQQKHVLHCSLGQLLTKLEPICPNLGGGGGCLLRHPSDGSCMRPLLGLPTSRFKPAIWFFLGEGGGGVEISWWTVLRWQGFGNGRYIEKNGLLGFRLVGRWTFLGHFGFGHAGPRGSPHKHWTPVDLQPSKDLLIFSLGPDTDLQLHCLLGSQLFALFVLSTNHVRNSRTAMLTVLHSFYFIWTIFIRTLRLRKFKKMYGLK